MSYSYLILPDLHNKWKIADQILKFENGNYQKAIWGNDIFDSFYDTPEINRESAIWLKKQLWDDKNIFLESNHVLSYRFSYNKNAYSSGFTYEKAKEINSVLTRGDYERIRPFYIFKNVLFTHAGLSSRFINVMINRGQCKEFEPTIENIKEHLESWSQSAYSQYETGFSHPLFEAGYDRGGNQLEGGILWVDNSSFEPIKNIAQIYFHSPRAFPDFKLFSSKKNRHYAFSFPINRKQFPHHKLKEGFGLDLDTHLENYATLTEDGKLQIFKLKFDQTRKKSPYDRIITDKVLVFEGMIF